MLGSKQRKYENRRSSETIAILKDIPNAGTTGIVTKNRAQKELNNKEKMLIYIVSVWHSSELLLDLLFPGNLKEFEKD